MSGESKCLTGEDIPSDLYFAKQVTTNACATQAILSVLMNVADVDVDVSSSSECQPNDKKLVLGKDLSTLKQFSSSFPPDLRGEAISGSEEIRTAHNSFARNDSFLSTPRYKNANDNDDVFHFIAYVPHNNVVYELDGLQAGPISHGSFQTQTNWTHMARNAIQKRIERYAATEIKFNLMAVVQDKRIPIQLSLQNADDGEYQLQLRAMLLAEEEKRKAWDVENTRRRHNYLPFCLEFIKCLAREDKLNDALDKTAKKKLKT